MRQTYEEMSKAAWPWTTSFLSQLCKLRPGPFKGSHLLFGSDYSGSHAGSQFRVYGFVIADADASPEWPKRCQSARDTFLTDGRRMSFKNLNDVYRRHALIPFLEAAESLEGHVVAVAVSKELKQLSTQRSAMGIWERLHSVQAGWDAKAFEEMARVAHLFSLFLSVWSSPGMNISWMTDEDDIVANVGRLEAAHQLAAHLSSIYVPHRLGEFMMNTPAVMADEPAFEDFLAIPDLAAGMLGEVLSVNPLSEAIRRPGLHGQKPLTQKSDTIADWFWHSTGTLKKTCILIDRATEGNFNIGQLKMSWE
jgi:hypothetical protein